MAVVFQRPEQAFLMQAAKASLGREGAVTGDPEGRQVGDGTAGTHGTQGVAGVVHPLAIKSTILLIHQAVDHPQYLALHGGEGLGGFGFDQVLVQGNHDFGQRQHEVRQR